MANKLFDRLVEQSGGAGGNNDLTWDLYPCDLPFAHPLSISKGAPLVPLVIVQLCLNKSRPPASAKRPIM